MLNTILLMSLCSSARGQEVPDSIKHNPITESDVKLSEVVVTGLTGSQKLKQSPSPVSIISPRQLEAQPSTNIIDAIAHQPGISQVTTGSGISKPVIRGLGYNRVVVVNDGIRQEGQQWGDEHGIEVDPYSVHSVEILKGPASLMYGSDAMGGCHYLPSVTNSSYGRYEGECFHGLSDQQRSFRLFAQLCRQQGWLYLELPI